MAVDAGYIASQQKRYTDALKSNDAGLVGRLEADAKRVGYTLTKPKPTPAPAPKPTPASTATKAGSVLGSIGKSAVSSVLDNAVAKAKLEPMVQAANNQTVAQPKPTTTSAPTLDAFVSASQNTQAKPAFDMFTKPVAPVTTSAPVAPTPAVTPVATAPFYNPTPVSTQTTLEKQAGILPTPTPTIEAYKAVAPTPTPTYTPSILSQPQTQLEKEAGIVSMTPLASGKQLTQGALSGIAQGIEEATGQPSNLQEAFNKATTTTPEVKTETQAPVTPEVKTEAVTPAGTAPTKASVRKQLISQPLTFENYKTFLDNISEGEQLSPEETSYLQNMRNEIYKDKGMLEKEMARTQDVIMERERQGLGIDSQQAYFTKLLSEMKKFEEPTVRATALPEDVPTALPKEEEPTTTAIEKPTETKLPEGSTVTVITKPDGSQVDGYVLNGQTFYKDGTRIATGDRVTINGKTYEMGADGKGIDLQKKATDDFLANPTAETWDAFNKSNPRLEDLTPEQLKIVEDYRNLTKTNVEENLKEQKRIEDKIMDMKAQELDTTAQERYLSLIRGAYDQLVSGKGVQGQPLTQEQKDLQDRELKSAYERAVAEVDRQNAGQIADLKTQAELATKALTATVGQQKELFNQAVRQIRDNSFIEQMKAGQSFANRGLLNSGMLTDALVRLNMSADQKITDTASKQIASVAKLEDKYQTTMKSIQDKQQRIVDGREADIEQAFKAIQKDQQTAVKTSQDAFIEQAKVLYNTVKTLSAEGMNTQKLNSLYADGLQRGDFSGMIQYMGTQDMGLSTKGALDVAKASKIYADQTGVVYMNGKPLTDPKTGKPISTVDAQIAAQKLQLDQNKIEQEAANIRAKIGSTENIASVKLGLEKLKLESKINLEYAKLEKAASEKGMDGILTMIKQGDNTYETNMKAATSLADDEKAKVVKEQAFKDAVLWATERKRLVETLNASRSQLENIINQSTGKEPAQSSTNSVPTGSFLVNPQKANDWFNTWKSAK